jgi:hypothetical protein
MVMGVDEKGVLVQALVSCRLMVMVLLAGMLVLPRLVILTCVSQPLLLIWYWQPE